MSFSRWSNFFTFITPIRTWRLKKAHTVYAIVAGVWEDNIKKQWNLADKDVKRLRREKQEIGVDE